MYGNKVFLVGIALSPLGLGAFLPLVISAGAVLVCVGAIMVLLDK